MFDSLDCFIRSDGISVWPRRRLYRAGWLSPMESWSWRGVGGGVVGSTLALCLFFSFFFWGGGGGSAGVRDRNTKRNQKKKHIPACLRLPSEGWARLGGGLGAGRGPETVAASRQRTSLGLAASGPSWRRLVAKDSDETSWARGVAAVSGWSLPGFKICRGSETGLAPASRAVLDRLESMRLSSASRA